MIINKIENDKKNKKKPFKFKFWIGSIKKININSFPSLPPIIFKLYNKKDMIRIHKKKKFL